MLWITSNFPSMTDNSITRKLTSILYADVAGYSRLTGHDEVGTHRQVMKILDQASDSIKASGGKVLRYAGDAILAEFASLIAAVETAASIQTELATGNQALADDEKIQIRIGINLGEVIEDRAEIYGDGVNLAARLESAAEPGGICLSSAVHDQIDGKTDFVFTDGGEQAFKNIDKPVRVYHWHPEVSDETSAQSPSKYLPLPDKPSIAVLPFDNMSNDPEQDFFADGITEDIITELSREKDLFVIARNSTFAYKGQSSDVKKVGRELGVKYVLEGSVRKAGNKIRLNAQLIEAQTNHHVWADRYDRALEDVFEVQDELTNTITNTLLQKVLDAGVESAMRRPPQNLAAYDHYMRAFGLILSLEKGNYKKAIREAQKAIGIEPDLARAHMILAWARVYSCWAGWAEDPAEAMRLSHASALKSIACDKNDFWGHAALAFAELFQHHHDRALSAIDQAMVLNPNSADTHAMRGSILNMLGRPEEGLEEAKTAVRLNPHHPTWYLVCFGRAFFLLGQYDDAIPYLERLVNAGEDILTFRALLVASYMACGRETEARDQSTLLLESHPDTNITSLRSLVPIRDQHALEHYMELLRKAGLPE